MGLFLDLRRADLLALGLLAHDLELRLKAVSLFREIGESRTKQEVIVAALSNEQLLASFAKIEKGGELQVTHDLLEKDFNTFVQSVLAERKIVGSEKFNVNDSRSVHDALSALREKE